MYAVALERLMIFIKGQNKRLNGRQLKTGPLSVLPVCGPVRCPCVPDRYTQYLGIPTRSYVPGGCFT